MTAEEILNSEYYLPSLDTCLNVGQTMNGHDDPNFKRIHHYNHHVALCIKEMMGDQCKTYCEIGTHFGHSLCTVLHSKFPSRFVAVDLFSRMGIAKDCMIKDVYKLAQSNVDIFNKHGYETNVLKGNSRSGRTIRKVADLCPDGIDLLFIDGDHRFKGVTKDFENYFPMVNSGGVIVFDDYLPRNTIKGDDRECPKAIDQLVERYFDEVEVVGLLDDIALANAKKGSSAKRTQNADFIVIKK
jgi:hypothetical protein